MTNKKEVITTLRNTADELYRLSSRIDERGEPLTKSEKSLVRAAFLPQVFEITDDIVHRFISGDEIDPGHFERILSLQI